MGSVCPSLFGGLDGCTKPLSLNWSFIWFVCCGKFGVLKIEWSLRKFPIIHCRWDVGVNLHIKSYSLEGSEFSNCRLFIEMAGGYNLYLVISFSVTPMTDFDYLVIVDGPWKHNSTWAGLAWIAVKANGSKVTAETRSVRPY
ncbi:hypothetical protein CsSME_00018683 [Camellia sinensis var. sinensis]